MTRPTLIVQCKHMCPLLTVHMSVSEAWAAAWATVPQCMGCCSPCLQAAAYPAPLHADFA